MSFSSEKWTFITPKQTQDNVLCLSFKPLSDQRLHNSHVGETTSVSRCSRSPTDEDPRGETTSPPNSTKHIVKERKSQDNSPLDESISSHCVKGGKRSSKKTRLSKIIPGQLSVEGEVSRSEISVGSQIPCCLDVRPKERILCDDKDKDLSECGMLFRDAEIDRNITSRTSERQVPVLDEKRLILSRGEGGSLENEDIVSNEQWPSEKLQNESNHLQPSYSAHSSDMSCQPTSAHAQNPFVRIFVGYVEDDEEGLTAREKLEARGLHCLDIHRDGCSGPEKPQIDKMMTTANWIVLYLSNIRCKNFDFIKLMAAEVAKESRTKKIVSVVSCSSIKLPSYLRVFPAIMQEGDSDSWLEELIDLLSTKPLPLKTKCRCFFRHLKPR